MTLSSCKRESEEMNSSDMPSAKYSLAGSPLELTSGSTAMLFSETMLVVRCRKKKTAPPIRRTSRTATTTISCHGIPVGLTTGEGIGAAAAIWRNFSGTSGLPNGSA